MDSNENENELNVKEIIVEKDVARIKKIKIFKQNIVEQKIK
jgi:hypothetical protein